MTKKSDPIEILNLRTGLKEEGYIYEGITQKHLTYYNNHWKPKLIQVENNIRNEHTNETGEFPTRHKKQKYAKQLIRQRAQDYNWDWQLINEKIQTINEIFSKDYNKVLTLECNSKPQGFMKLVIKGKHSRLHKTKQEGIIYIDLLASAPWNRPTFPPQHYKYVGHNMIATAVSISRSSNHDGRIGLHSLSQAKTFYEGIGMVDLGADKIYQNMHYYEMSSEKAEMFLPQ